MVKATAKAHGVLTKQFKPVVVSGQEKKDLATPRQLTMSTRRRVANRSSKPATRVKLQLNVISQLLAGERSPKNRFEKCLHKDAVGRAKKIIKPDPSADIDFACVACEAKQCRDCICAGVAALHGRTDSKALAEFGGGVRSPHNPVYAIEDPDDQKKLQAALANGAGLLGKGGGIKSDACHLVRLAYVAAMSGLAETVDAAAPYLCKGNLRGLRTYLDKADVVHRGGQCPGKIIRGQIAVQLPRFMSSVGFKIASKLATCNSSCSRGQRRQVLRDVVDLVFRLARKKEYKVDGCGAYKCKRLVEMILLAGVTAEIRIPHIETSDFSALAGLWPIPDGSRKGLRKLMPGMTTKTREQQAMKAISLSLGSGGNGKTVPVNAVSAMLCFWNEHKVGVLRWVPGWYKK